jgi:hypothetical protein
MAVNRQHKPVHSLSFRPAGALESPRVHNPGDNLQQRQSSPAAPLEFQTEHREQCPPCTPSGRCYTSQTYRRSSYEPRGLRCHRNDVPVATIAASSSKNSSVQPGTCPNHPWPKRVFSFIIFASCKPQASLYLLLSIFGFNRYFPTEPDLETNPQIHPFFGHLASK